ncbi:MAG: iron-sulfur cluster repair protein YtfE [Myxococcales bacterium]|nr:iron-sulfur cluster repair protein YtfE [Myxococcales bacterium]MCB9537476.1 iron-sulfur cluster repair protein YtfE [Myxococcales bacterium]
MIDSNQTLGQLATAYPGATRVFLRHRLDFCCGGRMKLVDACRSAGLDADGIVAEIAAADATPAAKRWDLEPLADLVDFIIVRFHESLRGDLPVLVEAAERVERVHGAKPSCPHGLAALLRQAEIELSQHLDKEEVVLFPALVKGGRGVRVEAPVRAMMMEHDDHGAILQRLRALTDDYTPPPEACTTWRALYNGLDTLETELRQHIHLENNILFPRVLDS